jgi:hypothetical protein
MIRFVREFSAARVTAGFLGTVVVVSIPQPSARLYLRLQHLGISRGGNKSLKGGTNGSPHLRTFSDGDLCIPKAHQIIKRRGTSEACGQNNGLAQQR